MNKRVLLVILAVFSLTVCIIGCSVKENEDDKKVSKSNTSNSIGANNTTTDKLTESTKEKSSNTTTADNESLAPPNKTKVLAQRTIALNGMTEVDIEYLTTVVSKINLRLESSFMFDNFEKRLSDPNSRTWNYLEQTGEIVIGYSFNEEDMKKKAELNLTEQEFEEQYGTKVFSDNEYDADKICEILLTIRNTIQDQKLIQDFDNAIQLIQTAKKTHDVKYFLDFYKLFHDMDYYLLRYGPEDVGLQVKDTSTIDLFYGMLECYKD